MRTAHLIDCSSRKEHVMFNLRSLDLNLVTVSEALDDLRTAWRKLTDSIGGKRNVISVSA